jgi:UrcA family protein
LETSTDCSSTFNFQENLMNVNSSIRHLIVLAVLGGSFLTGTAMAGPPDSGVRQQTVKFADLNLDRPEGIIALYTRLHSAASKVCDGDPKFRSCVADSIQRAVTSVGNSKLTAYYSAKIGRPTSNLAAANEAVPSER